MDLAGCCGVDLTQPTRKQSLVGVTVSCVTNMTGGSLINVTSGSVIEVTVDYVISKLTGRRRGGEGGGGGCE